MNKTASAFPFKPSYAGVGGGGGDQYGLTKREFMAATIAAGIASQGYTAATSAILAVEMTDALIAELAK